MKNTIPILLLIVIIFFLLNCDKEEVTGRDYPRIKTLPVKNISDEGAWFSAEILYRGDFEIMNYGFVWGENENPTVENNNRIVHSENIRENNFKRQINTTLKRKVTYYVRAFIKTKDYLVYGENVEFSSQGSGRVAIDSITPDTGILKDTVLIHGQGFSYVQSQNIVRFGKIPTKVFSSTDTLLKVMVPVELTEEKATVEVELANTTSISTQDFTLLKPMIIETLNNEIEYCSNMRFKVSNFPENESIIVHFLDQSVDGNLINGNEVVAVAPSFLRDKGLIKPVVEIANFSLISKKEISLNEPELELEYDTFLSFEDTLTIHYNNLSDCNIVVSCEDEIAPVISRGDQSLSVRIPADIDYSYGIPMRIAVQGEVLFNDKIQRQIVTNKITPRTAKPGELIRLDGRGYQPIKDRNQIYFARRNSLTIPDARIRCEVVESSGRHIIFRAPENVEEVTDENGVTYLGIFVQSKGGPWGPYAIDLE